MTTSSSAIRSIPDNLLKLEAMRLSRRQIFNKFMTGLFTTLAICSVGILAIIVFNIFQNGVGALNLNFFTQLPKAVGQEGGGIGQAIMGTVILLLMASAISVPLGITIAVFLSEFGRGPFAGVVRFSIDLLLQTPSIVVGIFVWTVLVNGFEIGGTQIKLGLSAYSGAVALSIIMVPIITRSVVEILRLVPDLLREAGLALGLPRWRVVIGIVIPTVRPGIITGVILSLARAAGETAPILLTMNYNTNWSVDLSSGGALATIPVTIYRYSTGTPQEVPQAWAATLVLILVIAVLSATVRTFSGRLKYES